MKSPSTKPWIASWSQSTIKAWTDLQAKASQSDAEVGKHAAFELMLARLRDMAKTGKFEALPSLLTRRITARALTWLWLSDDHISKRLLNPQLLTALLHAQQPRLTRITLQQLLQLYFRQFDLLDQHRGFRASLEQALLQQLSRLPAPRVPTLRADPFVSLQQEKHLLGVDGPHQLARQALEAGNELGVTFNKLGLQGLDDGRYGDICRAHFYLDTLRNLPLHEWASVMDELLKPSISKAPFEGERCIGHAALEILIDRTEQEPSDAWQTFILNLAGDPRIAGTDANYRQWWHPLGDARIQKVRGWLAKEDLRLFLQAVEQYGLQSHNIELQRMFPARKLFLEGLFKLNLIRNTRLLLGQRAQQIVNDILGKEVKTSFASMDGPMSDKAVIYLDCGDFYLIEGSHSFKIWVYLAAPSDKMTSYEKIVFSHHDLTTIIPQNYKNKYGNLPCTDIIHTPHTWQHRVFTFLAENGIGLDMEQLLSSQDYQYQLRKFGIPVVEPRKTQALMPIQPVAKSISAADTKPTTKNHVQPAQEQLITEPATHQAKLNSLPPQPASNSERGKNRLAHDLVSTLKSQTKYKSKPEKAKAQTGDEELTGQAVVDATMHQNSYSLPKRSPPLSLLKPIELKVLQYVAAHPGQQAPLAAQAMDMKLMDLRYYLRVPLKKYVRQGRNYGWHLTAIAADELIEYEELQRDN